MAKYNLGAVGGLTFTELINSHIVGTGSFELLDNVDNYSMIYVEWNSTTAKNFEYQTMFLVRRSDGTYVKKSEVDGYYFLSFGFANTTNYICYSFSDTGNQICINYNVGEIARMVGIN